MTTHFDEIPQCLNKEICKYLEPKITISLKYTPGYIFRHDNLFIISLTISLGLLTGQSSMYHIQTKSFNIGNPTLGLVVFNGKKISYNKGEVKIFFKKKLRDLFIPRDGTTIVLSSFKGTHNSVIKTKLSNNQVECLWSIFNEEMYNLEFKVESKVKKKGLTFAISITQVKSSHKVIKN